MNTATHNDVVRLYPGLSDHAVVEILAMEAEVAELEAAMALLDGDDKDLVEIRRREGDRINRLLNILSQSDIEARQDRDV